MLERRIYVLTGATSGLGLQLVTRIASSSNNYLVVGARKPEVAQALRAAAGRQLLDVLPLDLADLDSVRRFCADVRAKLGAGETIAGIACNAGLQLTGPRQLTQDGVERTFAANHLGHFLVVQRLLPALAPGAPVVATASGTHDPDDKLARRFGFRGGIFPSAAAVASGELDSSVPEAQQNMDRYATSKLCNVLSTYEFSRRVSASKARFIAFDPGLMPGTGLARDRSRIEQMGWRYMLPLVRFVFAGVSTPNQSAAALSALLQGEQAAWLSGRHYNYRLVLAPTSKDSMRADWAAELYDLSIRLTQPQRSSRNADLKTPPLALLRA